MLQRELHIERRKKKNQMRDETLISVADDGGANELRGGQVIEGQGRASENWNEQGRDGDGNSQDGMDKEEKGEEGLQGEDGMSPESLDEEGSREEVLHEVSHGCTLS